MEISMIYMNSLSGTFVKLTTRCFSHLTSFSLTASVSKAERNIRIIRTSLIAVIMICIISIGSQIVIASAFDNTDTIKADRYYSSIVIEENDTLWNIESHYNSGFETKEQYIDSIMKINNMTSDVLYSGQNLIIYYYKNETN